MLEEGQGKSSVAPFFQSRAITMLSLNRVHKTFSKSHLYTVWESQRKIMSTFTV